MNVIRKMLHKVLLVLLLFCPPGYAEEQRECFKCRARDRCFGLDTSSTERCSPDVNYCVKKETFSRVTGAVVTERYCGGRNFLDSAKGLVEERCYSEEKEGRRTSATVCYCSSNYCNAGGTHHLAAALIWVLLLTAVVL